MAVLYSKNGLFGEKNALIGYHWASVATGSVIVSMSGLDIKRLIKKMARNFGWIAVRYEVLGSSSIGLTDTFEFKAGSPLLQQCSDMIIRVVLRQYYGAVIDIRSSSLNKRVDLGFNNMMINK